MECGDLDHVNAKRECGYDVRRGCRFFCGNPVDTDFEKTTPHGIQGARYENLHDILGELGSVEEIANRLKEETWG